MITFMKTLRGFERGEFVDRYGVKCSIQKSSLATGDCIWLGTDFKRMHLTRDQVKELLSVLQCFVETGNLPDDET